MSDSFSSPDAAYDWLLEHSLETANLGSSIALLAWDQRTYIPPKGHGHRAEQIALLTRLTHARETDPKRGEALEVLEAAQATDPLAARAVNIREWRRAYDKATKIPEELVVALAKASTKSESAWEQARPENDWAGFLPHLEELVTLRREQAEALGYDSEAYDALMDDYEPGEKAADLEPIFARLQEAMSELVKSIGQSPRQPDTSLVTQSFAVGAQTEFGRSVIKALGFDFQGGRLDVSAHPFSISIGPGDSRITTRYAENLFGSALFGTVHETGHSFYETGLPEEHWGTPAGAYVSLGVHESQSRLWENCVARSHGFWRFFYPRAQEMFPQLQDVALDDFHFAINAVQPDLIRVEADEATYNLHILLRFELELALMRGDLQAVDLPDAWVEKMRALLGVAPETIADGAMQDVHWAAGYFGYFPTYTLGNLYAAQFFNAAREELGDLDAMFAQGEFAPLLEWLRSNIHARGMQLPAKDLVESVTGRPRDPEQLISYLQDKYSALYGL